MSEPPRASDPAPPEAGALQRASARVHGEPQTPWDSRSRFGPLGRLARRIVHRLAKPIEWRQRETDAALLDAIREAGGTGLEGGGALALAERIEGRRLADAPTPIGSFWVDPADETVAAALLQHQAWGVEIAARLQQLLRPGMTFVDVGANLGYFSVLASRLVGDGGRVVSVEPDPANVELLRANLWRNRCFNARVLPIAGWSEAGHLSLVRMPEGGGGSEVSTGYAPYADDPRVSEEQLGGVLVPCGKLDDLIVPPVDVMKVDAQFTDHQVIRGAPATIAASPAITLIVEFGPEELERRGEQPREILRYYRGLGFELELLSEDGSRPASDDEVMASGPYADLILRRP